MKHSFGYFDKLSVPVPLPMLPPEATQIGTSSITFASYDGRTTYFSNLQTFDCHDQYDDNARKLRMIY